MDYSLWDTLATEVRHFISEDEVLHEHWSPLPDGHGGQLVTDRCPGGRREQVRGLKEKMTE